MFIVEWIYISVLAEHFQGVIIEKNYREINNFNLFTLILDFEIKTMFIWSKNLSFNCVFHSRTLFYTQIIMIQSNLTDLKKWYEPLEFN